MLLKCPLMHCNLHNALPEMLYWRSTLQRLLKCVLHSTQCETDGMGPIHTLLSPSLVAFQIDSRSLCRGIRQDDGLYHSLPTQCTSQGKCAGLTTLCNSLSVSYHPHKPMTMSYLLRSWLIILTHASHPTMACSLTLH